MAHVMFSLLARSACVDKFTNSLSIFEIVEKLRIETNSEEFATAVQEGKTIGTPPGQLEIVLVCLLCRSDVGMPERPRVRLSILTPDGIEMHGPEQDVDLESAATTRLVSRLSSFPIRGNGRYKLLTQLKADNEFRTASEFDVLVELSVSSGSLRPVPTN